MRWVALLSTCTLSCWQGRPLRSAQQLTIPTPYIDLNLAFALLPGNQTEVRRTECARTFIGKDRWSIVLQQKGYGVEVDGWVMGHPGWRETYALRFRRPPVFGDIVANPSKKDGCIEYVVRVQQSRDGIRPDPWQTKHALTPMFEMLNELRPADERKPKRLFDATQDHLYPPGYP